MPNLVGLIQGVLDPRKLTKRGSTAIIDRKISSSQYVVLQAGRSVVATSATNDVLKIGDSIILVSTNQGKFIVGLERSKNRSITTVVING